MPSSYSVTCLVPTQPRQLIEWALKPLQSQGDPAPPLDWERIHRAAGHMTAMNLCRIKEAEQKLVKALTLLRFSMAATFSAFNPPTSTSFNPSVHTSQHLSILYRSSAAKSTNMLCVYVSVCVCLCARLLYLTEHCKWNISAVSPSLLW